MDLVGTFQRYLASWIPTRRAIVVSNWAEQPSTAAGMDVDRIHSVISSAETGDVRPLFTLYRDILLSDSHLQTEFAKRKLAVLGDTMDILPADPDAPQDVLAATILKKALSSLQGWRTACSHALDACLWPVAVLEKTFRQSKDHSLLYQMQALSPVPHILLDFSAGRLMIRDVDQEGMPLHTCHFPDPQRYIIHRGHLLSTPDNYGGPMRSILFWWLLSAMSKDWWSRFLDRYGSPFLVGRYDQADDASRTTLESAFAYSVRVGGLVVSKDTEVEIKQAAAASSGDAYEQFILLCQREKSKLVLGQTLSAEAQPTGLGSGVAAGQESVRQDIRQFDAACLADTIRDQLFRQFLLINNIPGQPPVPAWGGESPAEAKATGDLLVSLAGAGLQPAEVALPTLSKKVGFPLERKPQSAPVPFQADRPTPFSSSSSGARDPAAALLPSLREFPAAAARVILDSRSPEECNDRILAIYAGHDRQKTAALLANALAAHAALAADRHPFPPR